MLGQWLASGTWVVAVLLITGAAAAAGVAVALGRLSKRERAGADWTERARLAFPAGMAAGVNLFVLPPLMAVLSMDFASAFVPGAETALRRAGFLAAAAGVLFARYRLARRLPVGGDAPPGPRRWAAGLLVGAFLRHPSVLVALVAAEFLIARPDAHFGTGAGRAGQVVAVLTLAAGAAAILFFAFGGGLWLLRLLGIAKPASDRLRRVVDAVAQDGAGRRRLRGVYELTWPVGNAMALPLAGRLAFTDTAVRHLGDEELAAVAAHELAHLDEPWPVLTARAAGALLPLPLLAGVPTVLRAWGLPGLAGLAFLVLLAAVVLARVGRAMEDRADASAAGRVNPAAYGRALHRMYEINLVPAVTGQRRAVHGHLYDRLLAAGVQPDYPRPRPPPQLPLFAGVCTSVGLSVILSLATLWAFHRVLPERGPSFFLNGLDTGLRDLMTRYPHWTVAIRRAAPDDAEAICAVHIVAIRGLCAKDYTPEQIEVWAGGKRPEHYRRAMEQGEVMFVAVEGGGGAGGSVIGFSGVLGDEVRAVYVHPDHAGKGVGRMLLAAAESEARDRGVRTLRLNSTITAEGFYVAHGYAAGARTARCMRGVDIPCIEMSKPL